MPLDKGKAVVMCALFSREHFNGEHFNVSTQNPSGKRFVAGGHRNVALNKTCQVAPVAISELRVFSKLRGYWYFLMMISVNSYHKQDNPFLFLKNQIPVCIL